MCAWPPNSIPCLLQCAPGHLIQFPACACPQSKPLSVCLPPFQAFSCPLLTSQSPTTSAWRVRIIHVPPQPLPRVSSHLPQVLSKLPDQFGAPRLFDADASVDVRASDRGKVNAALQCLLISSRAQFKSALGSFQSTTSGAGGSLSPCAQGCVHHGPIGHNWSYLACRIGHLVPIWQPIIGSSFHLWTLRVDF
jgi:hypothetical protein